MLHTDALQHGVNLSTLLFSSFSQRHRLFNSAPAHLRVSPSLLTTMFSADELPRSRGCVYPLSVVRSTAFNVGYLFFTFFTFSMLAVASASLVRVAPAPPRSSREEGEGVHRSIGRCAP